MLYFRHYNRSLRVPNDKYLHRKYLCLDVWQYWLQTKHDYVYPTRQARIYPKACPGAAAREGACASTLRLSKLFLT